MRTLSTTLQAAQERAQNPLMRAVCTLGAQSQTFNTRIVTIDIDYNESWSQTAEILLDNRDRALNALDLKGYKAVIGFGARTVAGDEYSDQPLLWVTRQREDSSQRELTVRLSLEGIPNRIARDRALDSFLPGISNSLTAKSLLTAIAGATSPHKGWTANTAYVLNDYVRKTTSNGYAYKCTVAGTSHATTEPVWTITIGETQPIDGTVTWVCQSTDNPFVGCTAWTVTYDSEDSLIDSYAPKDAFRVYKGQTRLSALRWLIEKTGCVMWAKADGAIHVFVPITN